jgi:non-ribosomal peptide synthetase component F
MSAGAVPHKTREQGANAGRPQGKPSTAKSWLKAIELTSRIEADPNRLFADIIADWAARQPDRPALLSDHETFSYRELNERIRRYALGDRCRHRQGRHRVSLAAGSASAASVRLPH